MPQRTQRSYFREATKVINADGSVTPGERFLATDEPTEETFKRLIESTAFISEVADTAKTSEQGLVRITTGANVKSGTTPSDGFTYAAQVKNLPTITTKAQTIKDLSAVLVAASPKTSVTDRNEYEVCLSTEFISWLALQLDNINNAIPDISQLETDVQTAQSTADGAATAASSAQSTADGAASAASSAQTAADNAQSTADGAASQASTNASAIAALGANDGAVIGEIKYMAVAGAPDVTYVECNGQAISRATYVDLFNKIGTTFGAGDGSTTFNVPNFSGKGARGYNSANETDFGAGVSKGNDEITLTGTQVPTHGHLFTGGDNDINLADGAGSDTNSVAKGDGTGSDTLTLTASGTVEDAAGGDAIDIKNPYLTVFVYIKAQ